MTLILAILTKLSRLMFVAVFIGLFSSFTLAQTGKGDFNLSVTPTSATIPLGNSASFSVSLMPVNGFNETVKLTASASGKLDINFSSDSVRPPITITMRITAPDVLSPGTYTVGVTAGSGPITKSQNLTINVPAPTFDLSVSPTSVQTTPGSSLDFTVLLTGGSELKQPVLLKATSELPVSLANTSINPPGNTRMTVSVAASTVPRNYSVEVTATSGSTISKTFRVNIDVRPLPDYTLSITPGSISLPAGQQGDVFVNIAGLNGFGENVNLKLESQLVNIALASNTISGTGTTRLSINTDRNTAVGDYVITVNSSSQTKAGVIEKRATVAVTITPAPDFSLIALPNTLNIDPGKSATVNISINAANRFNEIVNLTTSSSNPNITTSLSTANIGPSSNAGLTINVGANVTPGNYDVSIFGSSIGLQRTTIIRVNVKSIGDFNLLLNPDRQEIMAGSSASFVINTMGQMGFAERITLSANVTGLQTSFSSATIDATATSTLTVNTTPETEAKDYLVTITANGGGITKTATAILTVKPRLLGDFTLVLRPDLQTISAGKTTSFDLTITPQNGFNDLVNLTAEVSESSIQVIFSNRVVRAGDNISATVITTGNTPPNNYSIRIIGASGSLVKTALFGLNVTPQVQEAFSLALAPNLQSIANGEATMFTVGVVGRNGFNQVVSLSASTTDPTIQLNFDNPSVNAGGNTFLTINTSSNTQPGTYTISITGRSGSLVVSQPVVLAVRQAVLKVDISFEPPPTGQIAPPQNVKVVANELKTGQAQAILTNKIQPLADGDLAGFKVYRLPTPMEGQPALTAEDLVKDENLIATLPNDMVTFTDNVPVGQSSTGNFTYSVTSFFGNGQNSNGSNPMGTELPVIRNPRFIKGTIFVDAASSFISATGATIIVNGVDEYPLTFNSEATQFTVDKKITSSPTSITLKKLIKKGQTVELVVKNPDGKLSVAKSLTRPKKK